MRAIRFFSFLLLTFFSRIAFAQDDEIPTYHNKWESFAKLKETDIRADLASFTLGGIDEGTGKQPLPYIPVTNYSDNFIEFAQDNIHIRITAERFQQSKHKVQYIDQYVVRVDNKAFYGVDGQMPSKAIASVAVLIGDDSVYIPPAAFSDIFEPRFCGTDVSSGKISCNTRVYLSNDKRKIYIYMLNSSGKGGYEVTWVIEDKKYLKRVIDYGF